MPRKATAAIAAYLLLYVSWQLLHWLPGEQSDVGDLLFLPVGAAAALAALFAARRCAPVRRLRNFWLLVSIAITCQFLGDTTTAVYGLREATIPFPSVADLFYLGLYPLMLLALLAVPVAPSTPRQRVRQALDLATVVLGCGMVIWYLVLQQTIDEGGLAPLQMATAVAYPLGDVVLVGGLGIVLLRWSPPIVRRPLSLIAAGLVSFVVADVVYSDLVLHNRYVPGGPVDGLWVIALGLFAIAAAWQGAARPGSPETAVPAREPSERRVSKLPFLGLAVGSVVLLSAEWSAGFGPEAILVAAAVALAGVIAIRQYVTQLEMIVLQRDLRLAHAELADLASRDELTWAANRRAVGDALELEVERTRRYGRSISVLFLDIDRFKSINDEYGHAVGDHVLAQFASVVKSCLRPVDVLGRWGGEEFLVILPETNPDDAALAAERIRARVASHNFHVEEGPHVTCSIGVAGCNGQCADAATLVELADRAMYEAKRLGRNRVERAGCQRAGPARAPIQARAGEPGGDPVPTVV